MVAEPNQKYFTYLKTDLLKGKELLIFDLDGTLYDQGKMRKRMFIELLKYYIFFPFKIQELNILKEFRQKREILSTQPLENVNISEKQYTVLLQSTKISIEKIKEIVYKWIHLKPLKFIKAYTYSEAKKMFDQLKTKGITTAVYSDYDAEKKLQSMELKVDYIFSSEQKEINSLKPNPKGLLYIQKKLGLSKKEILFIGDRYEKDGICAKRAGIDYIILNKKQNNCFFKELTEYYS